MSDENTTSHFTSSTPDLPLESVEAVPSTTTDAKPDLTPELVEAIPSIPTNTEGICSPDLPPEPVDAIPLFTIGFTSPMSKAWHAGMLFSTGSLFALGIYSLDSSVDLYVVLGVIAISITPVIKMIKARKQLNKLREFEEQKRKAAEKMAHLRANLSEEERQEQEREKIKAANEFAKRHAAKSGSAEDV